MSRQLEREYGNGYSIKNIRHMIRFAESFTDELIVSTLSRQLSWSHFKEIIYLKQPLQKEFYAEMCRVERWSVRTLRQKISSGFALNPRLISLTLRGHTVHFVHALNGKVLNRES